MAIISQSNIQAIDPTPAEYSRLYRDWAFPQAIYKTLTPEADVVHTVAKESFLKGVFSSVNPLATAPQVVTPLTNRVNPPNGNEYRGMYVYIDAVNSATDPLSTDTRMQNLINFCGNNNVNLLYLDMFRYLGASNWSNTNVSQVRKFISAAKQSTISVQAYAGDTTWGLSNIQPWVITNIFRNFKQYQTKVNTTEQFDGIHFDVEWWTDVNQTDSVSVPGYLSLLQNAKDDLNTKVSLFAAFFLKDNTSTYPSITYNGITAQPGAFLMDTADEVVVGAYRNTASAQIPLFQPWFDYESLSATNSCNLLCGVETANVTPSNITYFGQTKSVMEGQLATVSSTFSANYPNFKGFAIDNYNSYSVMSP